MNCHLSQAAPLEVVAFTTRPTDGPDPLALARFTVGRALLDGGGYGYCRTLYLDSDPVLVAAAGRIHQVEPDLAWLRSVEAGLLAAVHRMSSMVSERAGEAGLLVCRSLSGNSGSFRWGSNGLDVVGFGHVDGYVNAWAYRGLRNAAAMLADLGRVAESDRCRRLADGIRRAYAPALLNPETGFVSGWRSRDGALHDYAFLWVNGPAIAFGLLDRADARRALLGLERLRAKVGMASGRLGLPWNLLPIAPGDHMLERILRSTQPTFELYTDGGLSPQPATYYLRALATHGQKAAARKLAAELDEGYAGGLFTGGLGSGSELRSWEGLPTGYEGTLIGSFGPLYAIAIEQGILEAPDPEWWPANG